MRNIIARYWVSLLILRHIHYNAQVTEASEKIPVVRISKMEMICVDEK